ncbi:MAG: class I SAM-dependent methyltransferase [Xanthobacteraceae bacterium]
MTGFSSEWLALREKLDHRARNRAVLDAVAAAFAGHDRVCVVDLGSGTGSTLRALSGQLPRPQHWRLVDDDPVHLAEAAAAPRPGDVDIDTLHFDLRGDITELFDGSTALVTASALLDLVSEPWLANLAAAVAARSLPVYMALSYDGRVVFGDEDDLDSAVIAAVNAHQRRDKGFGPALGPRAAASAQRIFQLFGYTVTQGPSDWSAGPDDTQFQKELLTGWRDAAAEMESLPRSELEDWYARRIRAADAGYLTLHVGHVDFFARPRKR